MSVVFQQPRFYLDATGFPTGFACDVAKCKGKADVYHEACGHMACAEHHGPCQACKRGSVLITQHCRACQT